MRYFLIYLLINLIIIEVSNFLLYKKRKPIILSFLEDLAFRMDKFRFIGYIGAFLFGWVIVLIDAVNGEFNE